MGMLIDIVLFSCMSAFVAGIVLAAAKISYLRADPTSTAARVESRAFASRSDSPQSRVKVFWTSLHHASV
jgi:hypothetical protein